MKAIVFHEFGGIDTLQLEDVPVPEVGPGDALVRVRACGVNRLDFWVRLGRRAGVPLPHIPGSEVAGEIARVGDHVTAYQVGQAVAVCPWLTCGSCEYCLVGEETQCAFGDILGQMSQGGYAEYVRVPASSLVPIPPGVDFSQAAAVALSTITAWHMLITRARVRPGETVLVLAAGSGVGSSAVQIARLAGARVIATAGSAEKLALARELGADETIDHRQQGIRDEALRLTGGRGVDVVVEHVGAATWSQSIGSLARNGRLVTVGATTGAEAQIDIRQLYARQLTLIGSMGGTRRELAEVLDLVALGRLRPVIHRKYPLTDAATAQRAMEASDQFGKLLLIP